MNEIRKGPKRIWVFAGVWALIIVSLLVSLDYVLSSFLFLKMGFQLIIFIAGLYILFWRVEKEVKKAPKMIKLKGENGK